MLLLTWESIGQWMNFKLFLGGWWIEHILMSIMPLSFIVYYYYNPTKCQKTPFIFKSLFVLLILNSIYGIFMSMGYQDIQSLISKLIAWSLCFGWFYFQSPEKISFVTRSWCKYALPLFFVLCAFMQGEAVGRFFAPFAFVLIFFPYLDKKYKLYVLCIVIIVLFFGALGARSSVIRFAVAIGLAIIIYSKKIIPPLIIKLIFFVLIISPIVFLYLGITDKFNLFKIQEELNLKEYSVTSSFDSGEQEDLTSDTRTFLYVEEIQSALNNDYVIFGRSLSRGYDSVVIEGMDWMKGRNERWSSEVRMLNVFNYMGIVGVIIVSLVYIIGSWNAIFRSNSFSMQIIGLYVAFRWLYGWIEDFDRFDFINLYLWIPIFMCYSTRFLNMTEYEFKNWIYNFFKPQNKRCYLS